MNCPRCDSPSETRALQEFGGVCPKCLLEFAAEKDAPAFPNLEIVSTLGEGGMGVVYKAIQKQLGRTVALKVLSPQLSTDPAFLERFTREAKALAQLSHPNIVAIYDSGVHDGVPYLIMEHVEGASLRKLLAAGKLTPEQALEVVPQICDALQYAHSRGVVHRDVKPENILIDREGRVKIADFGLAKLAVPDQTRITRTNMVMGTPNYMAPEQIENPSAVDHRADIYSLGVIFYEMLTGELPLGRFKPPSERASTDCRLDPVVMKSLEKEPDDRYQSAAEVKEHVTAAEVGEEGDEEDRWGALWVAVGGVICLLTAGAILFTGSTKSAVWTAFAGVVCLLVAAGIHWEARGPRHRRRPPPPQKPAGLSPLVRTSPIAILAGILILPTLLCGLAAVIFAAKSIPWAELLFIMTGLLMLALLIFSIAALVQIGQSRGALKGKWIALTTLFFSGFSILMSLFILTFSARAPMLVPTVQAPPAPPVPPAGFAMLSPTGLPCDPFRLKDAWPVNEEIPPGVPLGTETEGQAALELAGLPKAALPELAVIRRITFAEGRAELVGLEFRTEFERRRWERETAFIRSIERFTWRTFDAEASRSDPRAAPGVSLMLLCSDSSPSGHAALEVLVPVLRIKTGKAGGNERERKGREK